MSVTPTGKLATILHPNIEISPIGKLYLFMLTAVRPPANHSRSLFTCKYRIYINMKPRNVDILTNCENTLLSGDFVAVSLIAGNHGAMSFWTSAIINEVITATERILVNKTGTKCVPKRPFSFMLRLDVHLNNLIETKITER